MQKVKLLGEDMKEVEDKTNNNIGKPFGEYQEVVKRIKLIEWAKNEIDKRSERTIVVKIADLAKEMGPDFKKIKHTKLFSALRYILFYNGLKIRIGRHKDGDKVFVISEKTSNEKLPQSLLELEKKSEMDSKILRLKNNKKEIDDDLRIEKEKIQKEREKMLDEIKHERSKMLEDIERERKLKADMRKEINELKKILNKNFEDNVFLVEVFQFNWRTLAWKLVRRKGIKAYDTFFRLIKEYNSSMENRYRLEFTSVRRGTIEAEKIEREEVSIKIKNGTEKLNKGNEIKSLEDKELLEKIVGDNKIPEEIIMKNIRCPRCEGNNISIFTSIENIRTRSGEKNLRYRCKDCNELFGDEDLKQGEK